ncbi:hypothetical protein [Dictyobacter arantiisoli]|uniref:Uncharacterized protein n=1 Tax=Dictyobacter arantiisoli TaxID=2014874 RepID=A0A5A5T903_9CHLR|nr:hypothetical protein [Dictyobacter arantiisoli]GCF07745.1 hypothetical protein KDI_13090 [Dictyobacter arantiisoli]
MNATMLPPNEFFIYVPDGQDDNSQDHDEAQMSQQAREWHENRQLYEHIAVPIQLRTWTRIALADTLAVYACLEEPETR